MSFLPLPKSILVISLIIFAFIGTATGQFGESVQYFPQMVFGGGATTSFAIHNPLNIEVEVEVELYSEAQLLSSETVSISSGGTHTLNVGDPDDELTAGWAKLVSTAKFEATDFFQITVHGEELPRVGVLPSPPSTLTKLFCFVTEEGTDTGVAIANPSATTSANLAARLTDEDGDFVLLAEMELAPREHMARFLTQEPFFPDLESFEGMLVIESDQPLILTTLRSDRNLLASVAVLIPRRMGELTTGSVHTEHIAQGAVTNDKIANNSVGSAKIIDGGIGPQDLADGAVTQSKLAAGTPTEGQVLTWNGTAMQWSQSRITGWEIVGGESVTAWPSDIGQQYSLTATCPGGTRPLGGGLSSPGGSTESIPILAISHSYFFDNTWHDGGESGYVVVIKAVTAPGGFVNYSSEVICANVE